MDRISAACFVVLACNLVVLASASYDDVDYHKLSDFREALHGVGGELHFLGGRAQSVIDQKADIDDIINSLTVSYSLVSTVIQSQQNARLNNIKDSIKDLLHRLGDVQARVAGGNAVAARIKGSLRNTWDQINVLDSGTLIAKQGDLAASRTTLNQGQIKLQSQLGAETVSSLDELNSLTDSMSQVAHLADTKKCFSNHVEVVIDPAIAEGAANVTLPSGVFNNGVFPGDSVPTVLCGIQSVLSGLQVSDDSSYKGYGYNDELQSSAVTVDCQPFEDRVEVKAFDQSRGRGNLVTSLFVQIKACSFAALAGFF